MYTKVKLYYYFKMEVLYILHEELVWIFRYMSSRHIYGPFSANKSAGYIQDLIDLLCHLWSEMKMQFLSLSTTNWLGPSFYAKEYSYSYPYQTKVLMQQVKQVNQIPGAKS